MKTIVSVVLMTFLASVMILPLVEQHAAAQAPTGPQGGAAPPTVKPQAPATPQQQAPQGGVSITVEVPVVTLDVIATTQHGDIIPGLKKENFRVSRDARPTHPSAQRIEECESTRHPYKTLADRQAGASPDEIFGSDRRPSIGGWRISVSPRSAPRSDHLRPTRSLSAG